MAVVVSICCQAYNHVDYIEQCLEGFVSQKTNFEFEILVHDDASTDGTTEILKKYEKKYPQLFKNVYQKENQFKKLNSLTDILFKKAEGKYMALCEGDDYWTDPYKLQKQVDFLEANDGYSLVSGGFKSINTETGEEIIDVKNKGKSSRTSEKGFDITIEGFLDQWVTKTLTVLFRREFFKMSELSSYEYMRDVHIFYHLLKKGNGYYIREVLGTYRVHWGGVFSSETNDGKRKIGYLVYKELYENNKNDVNVKKTYVRVLKAIMEEKLYLREKSIKKYKVLFALLLLSRNLKEVKNFIKLGINSFK